MAKKHKDSADVIKRMSNSFTFFKWTMPKPFSIDNRVSVILFSEVARERLCPRHRKHVPGLSSADQLVVSPEESKLPVIFFDLDNTLYPENSGVHYVVAQRIIQYLQDRIGIQTASEAEELHEWYYKNYGISIRGLLKHHNVDPLDYDQHIDGSLPLDKMLHPDPRVRRVVASCNAQKWVFTNAGKHHAIRCLRILNLLEYKNIQDFTKSSPTSTSELPCYCYCARCDPSRSDNQNDRYEHLTRQQYDKLFSHYCVCEIPLSLKYPLFHGVIYCDYAKDQFLCKPEESIYFEAMRIAGIDTERDSALCYLVDDSPSNILTAKRLGWTTIQVVGDETTYSIDTGVHAKETGPNFNEVAVLVAGTPSPGHPILCDSSQNQLDGLPICNPSANYANISDKISHVVSQQPLFPSTHATSPSVLPGMGHYNICRVFDLPSVIPELYHT